MSLVFLVSEFFAGDDNVFRVYRDDKITIVHVWRESGFVLAHQEKGNFGADSPEGFAGKVDKVPVSFYGVGFIGHIGLIGLTGLIRQIDGFWNIG